MSERGAWYPGAHSATDPSKAALVAAADGSSISYGELDRLATQTAHLLAANGIAAGDHVALWFDNDLVVPALWWGCHYAGTHYTLISARLTVGEAAHIINDAGAGVVLIGKRLHELHHSDLRPLIGDRIVILGDTGGPDGLRSLIDAQPADALEHPVEGAAMLYSSGTTGRPKGVKRALSGEALGTTPGIALVAQFLFGFDAETVYLSPAPLYHAAPYGYVSATTAIGGTAVVMEHFEPEAFLAAVERHRVTHTQVVPTMFARLLELPTEVRNRYDLSSLRFAVHAAAPCPVPIKHQMLDWWGPIVHEYYSGTEGVGFVHCSPEDWLAHPGSVGRPVVGEIHIVDENGADLPAGVDGDVYFAGGPTFEYHNDPEKTAGSYLDNGWATLGDIGHLDADGFLYLTDRRSNMLIVGGVNVYPQEAENVLVVHPAVFDAAVLGIAHDDLGEVPKAFVQLADGVDGSHQLAAELIEHCRAQLASVKCPKDIEFVSVPATRTQREAPQAPPARHLERDGSVPMTSVQTGDLSGLDFWAGDARQRDETFAELRRAPGLGFFGPMEGAPVPMNGGFWAVTRHADVVQVSRDPARFSSAQGVTFDGIPAEMSEPIGSFLLADAPRHTALRRLISKAFTPRRVQAIEGQIATQAASIVRDAVTTGSIELVGDLSMRLPLWTISEMVGIPEDLRDDVARSANILVGANDPELVPSGDDAFDVILGAAITLNGLATELAARRRIEPADDLLTDLVQASVDGETLTDQEIGAFFCLLGTAGNDTTRNSISHGVLAFAENPDQWDLLRDDVAGRIGGAVEEIIRWATPVMTFRRTATQDCVVAGQAIAAGDHVGLFYASANRDETVFPDPWSFDITRDPNDHLGFGGGGPHFCLGASLARTQLRCVFAELAQSVGALDVGEPEYLQGHFIHGIKRLPSRLQRA